ncbi:MAG: glycosyltransferase family 1 protein [Desulforudis sp.]|nr:MAG: glycosyltransferase family 1 protein [Desulforudis sp.]
MNGLRVLQVIRPAQGGMQTHLMELSSGLRGRGIDQVIACNRGAMAARFRSEGFEVKEINLPGRIDLAGDALSLIQLVRLIGRYNPGILHLHGAKAGLVGRVAGHLTSTPAVVYTVHNSVFYETWPGWKRRAAAAVERRLSRHADRVITVSEALRQELISVAGIAPDRLHTIHNGVREFTYTGNERGITRCEFGIGRDETVVGCVARLAPQKGLQDLLQAIALVDLDRPVHLLLVGSGPLGKELRVQAKTLGITVTFAGHRNDVPALLAAMDVFVLPSITEGLPLIILEAMVAGLPIVATRVGGIPEVVIDGLTGRLVETRCPERLAAAIKDLLVDRYVGESLAAAGNRRVRVEFSVDRMIEETVEVYRELSGCKRLH